MASLIPLAADSARLDFMLEITQKRIGRKEGMTVAGKDGGTEFVEPAESPASQVLTDENIRKLGLLVQRVFDAGNRRIFIPRGQ